MTVYNIISDKQYHFKFGEKIQIKNNNKKSYYNEAYFSALFCFGVLKVLDGLDSLDVDLWIFFS